ncbi:MAG: TetR/AcrR family transcriptional regulator [Deltaproteobacteria bacterium]|nr:TetR/AcrR family transcriptional regulator [Deltaproteobacteria bacterium]
MSSKREQLVATALKLFYRDGIHSTGIDKVLKESGVAKMTLYNHFKSKEELVAATLELQDLKFNGIVATEIKKHIKPLKKILAIFDALDVWFHGESYRGCYFINTVAEMGMRKGPLLYHCQKHKKDLSDLVNALLNDASVRNAATLVKQISILVEGAIVQSQVMGDLNAAMDAKAAAKILLNN